MKSRFCLAAALLGALAVGVTLRADDKDKLKDAKCPVSGKGVVADATVDFGGGKVYFCCENCPKAFDKDKAKFTPKANHQLVQTGQLKQTACPFTGKELNAEQSVDINGVKVSFCCGNCKGKVAKASADEQLKMVFDEAATKKGFKAAK